MRIKLLSTALIVMCVGLGVFIVRGCQTINAINVLETTCREACLAAGTVEYETAAESTICYCVLDGKVVLSGEVEKK